MRVLLTIEYNGTNFCGWQKQPNGRSVQSVLEDALKEVCGHLIDLNASGRTDAGVHALCQKAHFDTDIVLPADKISKIVNKLLPDDVKVLDSCMVSNDFHARFNVKKKTYLYKCYQSKVDRPLLKDFAYRFDFNVELIKMQAAAKLLVGKHDFTSFKRADCKMDSCEREIFSIEIYYDSQNMLCFEVCGSGFMHNMVRIIVGTLLDVGRGRYEIDQITDMLNERCRESAGKTVKACGLYLKNVEY